MIGTVYSIEQPPGDNYYKISVQLSVDFRSVSYVDIVENLKADEIRNLERNKANDSDL